jgi:hypothetical protein
MSRPAVVPIFHDIVQVLRTTALDPAFERWATHPKFLEAAWLAIRDDAETALFERAAGRLGASALTYAARFGRLGVFGNLDLGESRAWQLHASLDLLVDLKPKVLLVASAVSQSLAGQVVGRGESAGVAERTTRGAPPERVAYEIVPERPTDPEVRRLLGRIPGHSDVQRVIALWPDYLAHAWLELARLHDTSPWSEGTQQLVALARELVLDLPYGVALSRHGIEEELGIDGSEAVDLVRDIETRTATALLEAATTLVDVAGLAVTHRLHAVDSP